MNSRLLIFCASHLESFPSPPLSYTLNNMTLHDTFPSTIHHTFNGIFPPSPPESSPISERLKDSEYEGLPPIPRRDIPTEILDIDQGTADEHVARDKRLIRLTGNHPFNVEAPFSLLYDTGDTMFESSSGHYANFHCIGFLTSPELFFVRNHGAVPKIDTIEPELLDWEFSIEGLIEKPCTISLRELMSSEFPQVTIPLTLVCAGNRRKEQNMVRKSQGFSWGPAGVSTALFTGVLLADVLDYVMPKRGARYMSMEGVDTLVSFLLLSSQSQY